MLIPPIINGSFDFDFEFDFFFFNVYITKLIQVIIIGSRIIEYRIM